MRSIAFLWSGVLHFGHIVSQVRGGILGLTTIVKVNAMYHDGTVSEVSGVTFTLMGKCEVGDCGPFKVISIGNP